MTLGLSHVWRRNNEYHNLLREFRNALPIERGRKMTSEELKGTALDIPFLNNITRIDLSKQFINQNLKNGNYEEYISKIKNFDLDYVFFKKEHRTSINNYVAKYERQLDTIQGKLNLDVIQGILDEEIDKFKFINMILKYIQNNWFYFYMLSLILIIIGSLFLIK